ncbi:MAG: DUF1566 domain-containing protein [Deltaproteobacteria bacterium]|nr:DUF1566 domain-containing protein [Deltaproteobacteria bacterium]
MMCTHFSRWFQLGATAGWSSRAVVFSLVVTSSLARAADPATVCEAAKLNAAGKKAICLVANEVQALRGNPSHPAACEAAFSKAFANAEAAAAKAGGACPVTGDVAVIEDLVDTCVADIAATLEGTAPPPCAGTQFPATGQTTAYTADLNDGIVGPVAVPDDGTVQAGATLAYTDNGDGTVTDNNTGLMWEKKTSLDSTTNFANLHDADNYYHWSGNGSQETIWDWLGDVNVEGGTGYAGHNDWRIPNIKELQSIVDYSIPYPGPVMNAAFGPTVASTYWSSTSNATTPSNAWYVYFNLGYVSLYGKDNSLFVRAVRGGS